jgi:hypothetical protein
MRLTVLTDLSGPIVTRQDLFNAWANASLPTLQEADLGDTFLAAKVGSDFSNAPGSPTPGTMFWHQHRKLCYIWHDEIDNTGVSLWLCIGPDRFECACLAAEPIPAGAVVEAWFDRWVKVANPESNPDNQASLPKYMGVNQSGLPDPSEPWPGTTAESGTWVSVGIDGILTCFFPKEDTGVSDTHFGGMLGASYGKPHVGVLNGTQERYRGGLGKRHVTVGSGLGTTEGVGIVFYPVTCHSGMSFTYAEIKWAGRKVERSTTNL